MGGSIFARLGQSRLWLDPRTKLFVLVSMNIALIGGRIEGVDAAVGILFSLFPLVLMLVEHMRKAAFFYALAVFGAFFIELYLIPHAHGVLNLLLIILSGLITRFVPSLVMGYYVISTTRISELIAAMERMHIPTAIIIPFAVMLRFFPTVLEEMASIRDAMRMRGVRVGGRNGAGMLEYCVVPLMICSVRIGEELSAAALTRGLGKPVRRTSICRIGIGPLDWALIVGSAGLLTWMLLMT